MEIDLNNVDLDSLKALYDKETNSLKMALLAGASWDSLKEQRKAVTELSIALHKRIYSLEGHASPEHITWTTNSRKEQV